MVNAPAHWTQHSRAEVNAEVERLLAGLDIPESVVDDRRRAMIQACGQIAINTMCDLIDAACGDDGVKKAQSAIDGINALTRDMMAHALQRILPPN